MRISSPDLRLAFRSLARAPRFAAIAVLPLALAIGATSALFSVFQGVLLAPLPYESPDRLVRILRVTTTGTEPWQSGPNLMEMKARQTSLTALAGYAQMDAILSGGDSEPRTIATAQVSDDIFPAMGARALLGRPLLPEENEPGNTDVVVLSHSLWRTTFAGDPNVIGRTVVLDGATKQVVGVAEPDFRYPDDTELWTPRLHGSSLRRRSWR